MTDTTALLPVAVLCRNRALEPDAVRPLYEQQVGFQYLPESVWKDCRAQDGKLFCRGMEFSAVIDPEQRFPDAPALPKDLSTLADLQCSPAAPQLRSAHFLRAGSECWFLVNEGNTDLHTTITLPTTKKVGQYDLWAGKAARAQAKDFALNLPSRSSLLLFTCEEADFAALPEQPKPLLLPVPEFTLKKADGIQVKKTYVAEAEYSAKQANADYPLLELDAEEMAELWVNGKFAGVSFWNKHRFDLKGLLHPGSNAFKLVVTGSLANRYGKRAVPYGLQEASV